MKFKVSELRTLISEELILESKKLRTVVVNGKSVAFGSKHHLKELETLLEKMMAMRERQKRGTSARVDVGRVVSRLKSEIKKVKSFSERYNDT